MIIKKNIQLFLYTLVFTFCFITMYEWIANKRLFFTINPKGSTTKIDTALLFLLCTISLLLRKLHFKLSILTINIITLVIFIFSTLTLLEYSFNVNFFIDNFLIEDTISPVNPGRMSIATATCFLFFSLGILGLTTKNKKVTKYLQAIFLTTPILSFLVLISLILKVPVNEDIVFFKTMSLQTSLAFIILSYLLFLDYKYYSLKQFFISDNLGSSVLKNFLVPIIFIPIIIGYLILTLISKKLINSEVAIVIFTLTLTLNSFIILIINTLHLNKIDIKNKKLNQKITDKNKQLTYFKNTLDQVASILIIDIYGTIKYANTNFYKISEYTKEETIGKKYTFLLTKKHFSSFPTDLLKLITLDHVYNEEIKKTTKSGAYFWTNTSIVPLKKDINQLPEFMLIEIDITAEKKAEELLNSKYIKKLKQKNQELQQFTYIASHDLQEPLRTISSFTSFLQDNYNNNLDENAQKIFTYIEQSTSRMSSLIKNLLDHSRIGHKKELTKINCHTLIEELKIDLHSIIHKNNTTIIYDNLPTINAYKTMLHLLFQNLINNAIKFRKKDFPPVIEIKGFNKKNFWVFSIKDNGIGIKKEYQKKIFSIFKRVHSINEGYEGNGIGLAHCMKIVDLHEGKLWVESKLNEGSTFYFTISKNLK